MFYVDNVRLLTGLREFNFYRLVLKQQWEISPPSHRDTKQHQDLGDLEDLFLVPRYLLFSQESSILVLLPFTA